MKKVLLALTIFIAGGFTSVLLAYAVSGTGNFTDIDNNAYYANPLKNMVSWGVINGYPDNTFRPNNYVNRAEFATGLHKLFAAEEESKLLLIEIVCGGFKETDFTVGTTARNSFVELCVKPVLD